MEEFGAERLGEVLERCQGGAAAAGEAFARAFGVPLELTLGESVPQGVLTSELGGPGLIIHLPIGEQGTLLFVSQVSRVLPAWHQNPDAAQRERLERLAHELGAMLLPEGTSLGTCRVAAVDDLALAATRAECAEAVSVRLTLLSLTGNKGAVTLVWPARNPAAAFAVPRPARAEIAREGQDSAGLGRLPAYSRSLLRIKVPVMVTLAAKKQPLARVVEIVPGSILHFSKACDEPLDLEISNRPIAKGECVKVGEKFGLRITSLTLPVERFSSLGTHAG